MAVDNRIANIVGTPLPNYVKSQIAQRVKQNTQLKRDDANLVYLGNKTSWVRVVSSVDLKQKSEDVSYFSRLIGDDPGESNLAKKFVLFGGVSAYTNHPVSGQAGSGQGFSYELRRGLSGEFGTGAYDTLGQNEVRAFGYRPMPGISRVTVETQGRLGSIRRAKVEFQVWDKYQLDVIDMLYFKLGYTMLLEFGHTIFYDNEGVQRKGQDYSIDPFQKCPSKHKMLLQIAENVRRSNGNYDAMLGIVTNFSFSLNAEAGYDCTLDIISMGVISETLKINHPVGLPDLLESEIQEYNDIVNAIELAAQQRERQAQEKIMAEQAKKEQESKRTVIELLNSAAKNANKKVEDYVKSEGRPSSETRTDQPQYFDVYVKDFDQDALIIRKFGALVYFEPWDTTGVFSKSRFQQVTEITLDYDKLSDFIYSDYNSQVASLKSLNTTLGGGSTVSLTKEDYTNQQLRSLRTGNGLERLRYDFNYTSRINGINYLLEINIELPGDSDVDNALRFEESKFRQVGLDFINEIRSSKVEFLTISRDVNRSYAFNVKGKYTHPVTYEKPVSGNVKKTELYTDSNVQFPYTIKFTDTSLIRDITLVEQDNQLVNYFEYKQKLESQNIQQANAQADQSEAEADNLETQKNQLQEKLKYNSSIELILRAIQLHSLTAAYKKNANNSISRVEKIELWKKEGNTSFVNQSMKFGVFSAFVDQFVEDRSINLPDYRNLINSSPEDFLKLAAYYGFSTEFMKGTLVEEDLQRIKVDYRELFTSYVVPYKINQNIEEAGINVGYPTYIPLATLFMLINHMCVLYDISECQTVSNMSTKTPSVYLDFNPNTNYCLTAPQQLTTDPFKFLIPFEGAPADYSSLFDDRLIEGYKIKNPNNKTTSDLFNFDTNDAVSGNIPGFKVEQLPYTAKTLNALINCDYAINLIKKFARRDSTSDAYLKELLENLVSDLNRSLGNFNVFSVVYNDSANTYHIVDTQYIQVKDNGHAIRAESTDEDLPLLGRNSIAKSLEIRSEISSRLANMVAISANSTPSQQSQNSVDSTAFGYLNSYLSDRYSGTKVSSDFTQSAPSNSDVDAAIFFNDTISQFYGSDKASESSVQQATNYYINRMSDTRVENTATRASAMVPVTVNFTTHGISGMPMFSAFTIQDDLLPYTYNIRSAVNSNNKKVGFVVTGKTDTIDSDNTWNTSIKGQMLPLKNDNDFKGNLRVNIRRDIAFQILTNQNSTVTLAGNSVIIKAANLLKSLEGLASTSPIKIAYAGPSYTGPIYPYKLSGESGFTIGYGTYDVYQDPNSPKFNQKIKATDVITVEEAYQNMVGTLTKNYGIIQRDPALSRITENQAVALLSISYNTGPIVITDPNSPYRRSIINSTPISRETAISYRTGGDYAESLRTRREKEYNIFVS